MIRNSDVATLAISLSLIACGGGGGGGSGASISATTRPTATQSTPSPPSTAVMTTRSPVGDASPSPTLPPSQPTTPPATTISTSRPAPEWTALDISDGPGPREDHTWTVAEDGLTAYLFGGRAAEGPSNELWQFDLATATWSPVQPTNGGPEARFGHTATWVPDVGLVIWSGQSRTGFFDDSWRFEPSANLWEQLPSSGAVPSARYGSCASLGPDGDLWISHGFTADSGRFSDTRSYSFSSGAWTDRTPQGPVPVKRCLHDCFWSSAGQLILYGGQTTGVPALGDLWSFDPTSGSWSQAADPPAPARQLYGLATNADVAIVYGGGSADRGYLDDSWRLDPAARAMTEIEVGGPPPRRSGAALIVDPLTTNVLMFGGQGSDGLLGDTWALSGALDR